MGQWISRSLLTSSLLLLLLGCGKSLTTEPPLRTPTARPTATPVPEPNIAGTWSGHYSATSPLTFCEGQHAVSATFSQDGVNVTGSITIEGCASRAFQGTLRGTALSGTLGNLSLGGTASDSQMRLKNVIGELTFATMNLDR